MREARRDFRILWQYACVQAGVGQHVCCRCGPTTLIESKCANCKKRAITYRGLLFHDLRRTAARNLRAVGVAEGVIMKIGGWKTRSVFERYAIVTNQDVADAMSKLDAHEAHRSQIGHNQGFSATLQAEQNSTTLGTPTV